MIAFSQRGATDLQRKYLARGLFIYGDTAIGSDERKTTKQEKDKLDKFKHSSKTTDIRLSLVHRTYLEIFSNSGKLLLVTYHSQNSKIKKFSGQKIWSTFKGFDSEIINFQE